jgi:hypothetical protein
MPEPTTKDNLESAFFLGQNAAIRDRLVKCLRNDAFNIRPFSPPSETIEVVKQALNKVQPKIPGMKKITDPSNTFGQSMHDAVLQYKSVNGIIRSGQKLDPIVGRMTLARLDTELKNGGGGVSPAPPTPKLEFGSTRWKFSFFGNKGIFGKGVYALFIGSLEVQDSFNFDIDEVSTFGNMRGGFKGTSLGQFITAKKMHREDFDNTIADITITRQSRTLRGSIRLQKLVPEGVMNQVIPLTPFKDDSLSIDDGTLNIRGTVKANR